MSPKYETYQSESGQDFVKRINDNGSESHFAADPANSDYQRYLRWLENPDAEEGGTL